MIIPAYFENLLIQSENALPNRAYFIPASNRFDDSAEHRERSDRFQSLNGDWKFRYYSSIHDLTERFYEETNCTLSCANCEERLCAHKKQLHQLHKKLRELKLMK